MHEKVKKNDTYLHNFDRHTIHGQEIQEIFHAVWPLATFQYNTVRILYFNVCLFFLFVAMYLN